jgi:MoxR-like ATPase
MALSFAARARGENLPSVIDQVATQITSISQAA